MAGEQTAAPAAAAPETVTSPLSSPSPAPAASATPAAPAAASPQTPSSPDGTTPASPAAVVRPEGIPDTYWDAITNSLKVDPESLVKDLKERDELKAFKAAEDTKALSRPQTPEAYKLDLPADFTPPAGVEFKFDANDPILAQARAQAHADGLSQESFSKMLGLYAAAKVGEESQIKAARTAEIAKLGSTAAARVDAVVNWVTGMDGTADKRDAKALASMLVTAAHVEAFERLMLKVSSQGAASFSQQHRDVSTGKVDDAAWAKMSYSEKKAYAEKHGGKSN